MATTKGDSARIGALDAVRGMAILAVIATHANSATVAATGSYDIPRALFRFMDFGMFGVQLFFALSGWLLFSLYTGDRPFSQRSYWARRLARIWPLWLVFVAVYFWLYGVPEAGIAWPVAFIACALFLGWLSAALVAIPLGGLTIQQEMGHYALFSVLRRRSAAFLAGTVIAGYASAAGAKALLGHVEPGSLAAGALEAWLRLALFHSWPFFLLGGAAYATMRRWQAGGIRELAPDRRTAGLIGVAVLLGMLTTYQQDTPGFFVVGFVATATLLALMVNALPVAGGALRSIGRYSYFMYFFHFLALRWLQARYIESDLPGDGATSAAWNVVVLAGLFVGATAVSWAAGWVSWRVFEGPIVRWAHRIGRTQPQAEAKSTTAKLPSS